MAASSAFPATFSIALPSSSPVHLICPASSLASAVCFITLPAVSAIREISPFNTVIFSEVCAAILLMHSASSLVFRMMPLICCFTSTVAVLICSVSFLYWLGISFSSTGCSEKSPEANCLSICTGASVLPISPVINIATSAIITKAVTTATIIIVTSEPHTWDVGHTTPSFQLLPVIFAAAK